MLNVWQHWHSNCQSLHVVQYSFTFPTFTIKIVCQTGTKENGKNENEKKKKHPNTTKVLG
uniref:Uncharacterized protein n=1 Tax=Anguilla anguilla TaxID=7936 RepID=A0A0E9WET8_ANGAN